MTQTNTQAASKNDTILRWTIHLAPEHPLKLLCALGVIALVSVAAHRVIGPLGSMAVAAALVGSLADFLFPITYEIKPDRVTCRMLFKQAEIMWRDVRKCYLDAHGIKLSPLARPSRLEAFRGVYLRFDRNKEQVIEAVRTMREGQC